MSKDDLQARAIYYRKRNSIEAQLPIVLAALAFSHWIETTTTGTTRNPSAPPPRHHHSGGPRTITAADPVPGDLQEALTKIHHVNSDAHEIQPDQGRISCHGYRVDRLRDHCTRT